MILATKNACLHRSQEVWPDADKIRDELLAQGIQLKDGKDPETGERVTTWEVRR
jgi:cysteinyl-tRNA synthetase